MDFHVTVSMYAMDYGGLYNKMLFILFLWIMQLLSSIERARAPYRQKLSARAIR